MPTPTTDQGLVIPDLADAANANTAFAAFAAGVESRLVLRYVDEADRTARNPVPVAGQLSYLASPGRWDRWTGAAWWEAFPLTAYKTAELQTSPSSTVLINDTHLVLPMQINARYLLDGLFVWDSGTTGDIKWGWTVPAGAAMPWWVVSSVDIAVTTGIGNLNALPSAAAGTTLARAGSGIGTFTYGRLQGVVNTGGTAGNLQNQWAQQASEAVATRMKTGSWMTLTRVG